MVVSESIQPLRASIRRVCIIPAKETHAMKLRVATGQFPVTADVDRNLAYVRDQIASAGQRRANVVIFPEAALGGYAGEDFGSFAGYDWGRLEAAHEEVARAARGAGLWVICGTNYRTGPRGKPHNSLLAFDPTGELVARYDKRLCTGPLGQLDLAHYEPGDHSVVLEIADVRCGLLICHEWRYPEPYRAYKRKGIEVILQGWYDGGHDEEGWLRQGAVNSEVIPATVQGHAVCNHLWICGTNTSRRRSCFGAFVVRPDGLFQARLPRNRAGVMVETLDTGLAIPDLAGHLRGAVMRGLDSINH